MYFDEGREKKEGQCNLTGLENGRSVYFYGSREQKVDVLCRGREQKVGVLYGPGEQKVDVL